MSARCLVWCCVLSCVGCASNKSATGETTANRSEQTAKGSLKGSGDPRCDASVRGREVTEYDTSGDNIPDVRKVFEHLGDANNDRMVMICREADINRDGKKDVVRLYDDEGKSLREEADRNFDGKPDQITVYQNGEIVVQEFDQNFDGKIDTKVFYEQGKPQRVERDLAGRSTPDHWRPDRWEYFESGRMVRMGTDTDGDGRVDHWDRDADWKRKQDASKSPVAAAN